MSLPAERPVAVSGDRPTGRLHLGHLAGTLETRLRLQETHRCFFLVADLHALADGPERIDPALVDDMVLDWMSTGLDPGRAAFVRQSSVPEIAELAVVLSMRCPVARLRRLPALKEKARRDGLSLGRLAYPVLMAADVLSLEADVVPIGEDQESHLELARELARGFNRLYDAALKYPAPLLGRHPRLPGTDGARKMSKSLGNAVFLADDPAVIERKVRGMYTDPRRVRADVPGTVEGNPVFVYHDAFNPDRAEVEDLKERYRSGRVGDAEVKAALVRALERLLAPFRERRASIERGRIPGLLAAGSAAAREAARAGSARELEAMGLSRSGP